MRKHVLRFSLFLVCMSVGLGFVYSKGYLAGLPAAFSSMFTRDQNDAQLTAEKTLKTLPQEKPENPLVRKKFDYTRDSNNAGSFSRWFKTNDYIFAKLRVGSDDKSAAEEITYEFCSKVPLVDSTDGKSVSRPSWTVEVSRYNKLTKASMIYRIYDINLDGVSDPKSDSQYSWEELQAQYDEALALLPSP